MSSKPKRNVPAQLPTRKLLSESAGPGPLARAGEQTATQIKIDESSVRMSDAELEAIRRIQELRSSKLLIFIAAETVQMKDDVALIVFELLKEMGKTDRIDMIVHSRGGQTEVPAKLVSLIRNYCDHFGVIIPFRAHSAATHLALGANEIVMGPMSELGPVDPSRTHPLLPKDKDGNPIPISVQDLKHVVELLKREGPGENYSPEALATIFSTMFEYIHPLAMGAIEQSYALAKLISKKLLATHMDAEKDHDTIERIANELSDNFKSHSYQIGWKEAKALGLPISFDDGELYARAWKLYELISPQLNTPPALAAGTKVSMRPIVVIETEISKHVLFEISELIPEGAVTKLKPLGAKWISTKDLGNKPTGETTSQPQP